MNIEDVKQIPIADYLHSLGYSPVKQQGNGLWYKSPLREEHEPSFKVNTDRNLWYDFGAGKGGNIIALATSSPPDATAPQRRPTARAALSAALQVPVRPG